MTHQRIGFTCAYAPVPIIEAAGFVPYRVLPFTDAPDQAGHLLHDNLCPHVKRVLDRALANDLPELAGMVFVNSCDSMRRLCDAWKEARPADRVMLIDLPSVNTVSSQSFLAGDYRRMAVTLSEWADTSLDLERLEGALTGWNRLAESVSRIQGALWKRFIPGLAAGLQRVINAAATEGSETAAQIAETILADISGGGPGDARRTGVPVYLFGNLLFDPGIFDLFESWNLHVAGNNFCTGSRFVSPVDRSGEEDGFFALARAMLERPPCARTMNPASPGDMARQIADSAKQAGASGVIGFTLKFCDPYLARMPMIREELKKQNLPFLMIEGDCTMGSMGQQQTRIEAFCEMLEV